MDDAFSGSWGTVPELLFEKKGLIPALQQLLVSRPLLREAADIDNERTIALASEQQFGVEGGEE